jgi:uncharacterized protein YjbI with pentapeptide repeats
VRILVSAHLERAILLNADFKWANLMGAHLGGAIFAAYGSSRADALGLSEADLRDAHGDTSTQLPEGIPRPAHWPRTTPRPGVGL